MVDMTLDLKEKWLGGRHQSLCGGILPFRLMVTKRQIDLVYMYLPSYASVCM